MGYPGILGICGYQGILGIWDIMGYHGVLGREYGTQRGTRTDTSVVGTPLSLSAVLYVPADSR